MASNPLVDQGTLNRLRGSVTWPTYPSLNVTAPFLARRMISLGLNGAATNYIGTATGQVTSREPYFPITLTIALLRTNGLGDLYKKKIEVNSLLGNGVVRPDTSALSPFQIFNCGIESVQELTFDGSDPGFLVTIGGFYPVNADMWDLT